MRARLRRLHSPDVFDLRVYRPPAADSFAFLLQVIVGPEGEPGEESFDIMVCTPRWLEQNHEKGDIVIGRHLLLVFEYDYDRLVRFVKTHVEQSSGETWFEVAQKLGRLGKWEFEDYQRTS